MEEQQPERRMDRSSIRVEAVRKQLKAVMEEGGVDLMVVADDRGGLVAEAEGSDRDRAERLAVLGGPLQEFRRSMRQQADIRDTMDIHIRQVSGRRLTCRFFDFRESELSLLAVTRGWEIPEDLLERAVSGIVRILEARDVDL